MLNKIKDIEVIDAFENESETIAIDNLTFENRTDRVSIFGSIDITRDKIGLENVYMLKQQIDLIYDKLKSEDLPDKIEVLEAKTVENPFK
ncbi:MAG: hypothetical protein PHO62_07995 [Sulfurimonas sp.]|uniref:hypothetical protein n=1 Tax=Sulfurimonas sp. TaxID=2022749 RepID=UPI00261C274B|nr:hypothetical protein [Sulfurimonas sp.]MDD5373349.1 hypothetical protein [Sulfurimonas sp.]